MQCTCSPGLFCAGFSQTQFELMCRDVRTISKTLKPVIETQNRLIAQQLNPWSRSRCLTLDTGFRRHLAPYYGSKHGQQFKCMVVSALVNSSFFEKYVVGAHVWPRHTKGEGLEWLNLKKNDLHSPRNGIVLLRSVELAFDASRFCFLYDKFQSLFFVKVLDPTLNAEKVALYNIHADDKNEGHVLAQGNPLTFQNLDGVQLQTVVWENGFVSMPFRRLLACHAKDAYGNAFQNGWIDQETLDSFEAYRSISDGVPESIAALSVGECSEKSVGSRTKAWVAAQS